MLLSRLEELQKAREVSELWGKVASAQSEISSLREHIDKERVEKLSLKHEVHLLKTNLENWDKDVKELRVDDSRQSGSYDELWKAHEALLEETQKLCSRIIFLSLSGPAEGSGGWKGVQTAVPRGMASNPGAQITSQGGRPIRLGALVAGAGDLTDGRRTKAVVLGGAK